MTSIVWGTTTKNDGNWAVTEDYESRVTEFLSNRTGRRPKLVAWATQVHRSRVQHVRSHSCLGNKADALYTEKPGIALVIRTADCVPVFVEGPGVIGLAHAGFEGVRQQILPKLLKTLQTRYEVPATELRVWFGPHICEDCFALHSEWLQQAEADQDLAPHLHTADGKQYFSLRGALEDQTRAAGATLSNQPAACTFHDSGWFSHRRDRAGRLMLSYIMLSDP